MLAAAILAFASVPPAAAQSYPDKPIRVIVPFPAGGGGDTLARLVMNKVGEVLGAAIVIDNRAGAGGEVTAWDALFAPRGTPKPMIDKLNSAVRKALDDAQLRAGLLARGAEPVASTPEELARHVASEVERWGKVVRACGATID